MGHSEESIKTFEIAKPHTIKKFDLVENYVDEWARKILGVPNSKGVVFIDCMCNRGIYTSENGDYVMGTPIRVARKLDAIIQNYNDKNAILFFNDLSYEKVSTLESILSKDDLKHIHVFFSAVDASDFLKKFDLSKYNHYNKLLFYDPYIASIDWDAITPFLHCWGEVIINHMVHDTVRGITQVHKTEKIEKYEMTYQEEIDDLMKIVYDRKALDKIVINILKKQSLGVRNQTYIASFPFYNRTNGLVYNLIHYSQNIEGFKLFKKVAWKTFNNRSSGKKEAQVEGQLCFDFGNSSKIETVQDDNCYCVDDIASYIYNKYCGQDEVPFKTVYDDLDNHPVFPGEGYRQEIRSILKQMYKVTCSKTSFIFKK